MSLRLLVDEDSQAKLLVTRLREAGHDILTVSEVQLDSASDPNVLAFAKSEQRIVLTRNCADFMALHAINRDHAGIICIFMNADMSKDMSYAEIAAAVGNVDAYSREVNWNLAGEFVPLNSWKY